MDVLLFRFEGFPKLEAVEALPHHNVEHHGRLAIVTDKERRRVLIPSLHAGDIGESSESCRLR